MPELPEVETVRRGLNQVTQGQKIIGGEVLLQRTLAYPNCEATFLQGIAQTTISNWQRRGKYLLANLDNGSSIGVHLRMTGQLLWVKDTTPLPIHTRLRFFFANQQELRFVDTRTFGKIWWIAADKTPETVITGLKKLGLEPFDRNFTPDYLYSHCQKSRRPIKTFLLDQNVVAGIGNIYADEVLFKSGIHPQTAANLLKIEQIDLLTKNIISVLETAIAEGGTSFSDFLHVTGVNGNYGAMAWVYGRNGENCRLCGATIARIKLSGRSAHFCPQCQVSRGEGRKS
ncbi:MAG: DNA-formamidopyrimidine glycosylase [Microcystis sp. M114S2]|jgi:formamidopyrimidine-DNA glycosylase|uniref:DNA-formamidopyrimidine glycosylase n=1 Tax=unclassified Microcystis TaxID=2643300 RepID=UPI001D2319F2|nr:MULTISPECIES: DNA-formamidopyrimidine glycosylase [unclassified Microcystis]MBE5230407.1 DNA-formamidopyrimidine glycosylase [Microcystis aeruginosa PMC 728.11]MCA2668796.1 DNA-formamidopyrimidine glycosylase [Microcystis sp. M045S2]MCA2699376.1 DNA-formamidopyrimidine glycosylase [Microcystis sp. M179S2]MCA2716185.1 DNA-formamidopyrimidine glycosylase [Microcystis sp. M172S2]MCA2803296.1 DNA-formamidopyrimidine glycosylase [Microcystis sp. M114S2]